MARIANLQATAVGSPKVTEHLEDELWIERLRRIPVATPSPELRQRIFGREAPPLLAPSRGRTILWPAAALVMLAALLISTAQRPWAHSSAPSTLLVNDTILRGPAPVSIDPQQLTHTRMEAAQ